MKALSCFIICTQRLCLSALGKCRASEPSEKSRNSISGKPRAFSMKTFLHSAASLWGRLRWIFRAGMFSKRSSIQTEVPLSVLPGRMELFSPLSTTMRFEFESIVSFEQELMLLKASPLKPSVLRENRSSRVLTLLVAWLSQESRRSSSDIPLPLSVTVRFLIPPCSR